MVQYQSRANKNGTFAVWRINEDQSGATVYNMAELSDEQLAQSIAFQLNTAFDAGRRHVQHQIKAALNY